MVFYFFLDDFEAKCWLTLYIMTRMIQTYCNCDYINKIITRNIISTRSFNKKCTKCNT